MVLIALIVLAEYWIEFKKDHIRREYLSLYCNLCDNPEDIDFVKRIKKAGRI